MLKVGDRVKYIGNISRWQYYLDSGIIERVKTNSLGKRFYAIKWDRGTGPAWHYPENLEILTPLELDWVEIWEDENA